MHLLQHASLQNRSFLLIDKAKKNQNDRTWCFWETNPGLFEPIVHHRWNTLHFFSSSVERTMQIAPYQYKMIRGIDFYNHCLAYISQHSNVDILYTDVTSISESADDAMVTTTHGTFTCKHLFNSIVFKPLQPQPGKFLLLQHFKGWLIETDVPSFDPGTATLMDFRVSQEHGTTFVYVMPLSTQQALVEYTLFTPALLQPEQYDAALRKYITEQLQITGYHIRHEEFGIIPMTNIPFEKNSNHITHIGTAGGNVKASSGYAFRYIQKNSAAIANALAAGSDLSAIKISAAKFSFYDSVFLNVLTHHQQKGADIFSRIFRSNNQQSVFRFLDNESSLREDLSIITSLASMPFVKAGITEIFKQKNPMF